MGLEHCCTHRGFHPYSHMHNTIPNSLKQVSNQSPNHLRKTAKWKEWQADYRSSSWTLIRLPLQTTVSVRVLSLVLSTKVTVDLVMTKLCIHQGHLFHPYYAAKMKFCQNKHVYTMCYNSLLATATPRKLSAMAHVYHRETGRSYSSTNKTTRHKARQKESGKCPNS